MKRNVCLFCLLLFLCACQGAPVASIAPAATDTPKPALTPLPLSEPGAYKTGLRTYELQEAGHKVSVSIWYPAIWPSDYTGTMAYTDAKADPKGAPYPLILSSAKLGRIFGEHMASCGFVALGVEVMDSYSTWDNWLIDFPLDLVFALNQVASKPLAGLEGMINANAVGALGYSFDGYNSLALSGARVDPDFYLKQCKNAAALKPAPPSWWIDYTCAVAPGWDKFTARAGEKYTANADGLWKPFSDARIRAVMPMAPEGAWLFGERGLAAADRPTLIIGAAQDDINLYDFEAVYIYNHLGTSQKTLITFLEKSHMMILDTAAVSRMKHFAAAFFGFHLQGRSDYAGYYSKEFLAKYGDLFFGVYAGK